MKTWTLLFCLATSQLLHATVRTVSNEPGYPAQYTTVADAIAAAAAGDTLYLTGSGTSYGTIYLAKPLTIIGAGYNNGSAATTVGSVFCRVGSTGSKLIGLYVAGSHIYPTSDGPNTNILIERCRFYSTQNPGYSMDGLVIKNCVIDGPVNLGSDWTNVLITNNLLIGSNYYYNNSISGSTSPSVLISNNVFSISAGYALQNIQYAVVSNNIFYGGGPANNGALNCAFNNNISYQTPDDALPPTGNVGAGNLVGVDPLFVNVPDANGNLSYDYHLQAGSPGKNAGTDGTDIGLYGGGAPLVGALDGVARIPLVTTFNLLNSSIGLGGSLNVQIAGSKHD